MTKDDVLNLLEFIALNYPNFNVSEKIIDAWLNELQQYDLKDVKENLKSFMADEYYQKEPPKLSLLIKNLTKKHEKIDLDSVETLCHICHKPLSLDKYEDHIDRCLDVNYVIQQSKKWFNKDLTRKELFDMPQDEFKERYDKLLNYIFQNTSDESERTRMGFIFNPPSKERAKSFLESSGL